MKKYAPSLLLFFFLLLAIFVSFSITESITYFANWGRPVADQMIVPEPSETVETRMVVTLPPSFSSEEPDHIGTVKLCDEIDPGRTVRFLVKGDPPIANGGYITISMMLAPDIELMFLEPVTRTPPEAHTGSGTIMSFMIPGDQEQKVLMLVRNVGNETTSACLRLSYEYQPEPEPEPEHKGRNDPPLPEVSTPAPTPQAL